MTYTLTIGERSHGTLRDQDLASAMLGDFDAVKKAHDGRLTYSMIHLYEGLAAIARGHETDHDAETINEAMAELEGFCPAYCRYGFHEGDGSLLGVWPDWEAMEMAEHDGEILRVSDLSEVDHEWRGAVMLVNDHGNVTLYQPEVTWREVWAAV